MFLNIITPCSRPQNLIKISESINIPKENYRWIIVFDMNKFPSKELIPDNCEIYLHRNSNSTAGHAQRNFALELIDQGHVYMNDDDTLIHPDLWENIKNLEEYDFISFQQNNPNNTLRLMGSNIQIGQIDSHNFIISRTAIGNDKWEINRYEADGIFASNIFKKIFTTNLNKVKYIPKVLSIYNSLR